MIGAHPLDWKQPNAGMSPGVADRQVRAMLLQAN
jgi:hypothetical protein